MNTLINITNLNVKNINKQIIQNLNLSVFEGETLVIIGRSGNGKSTLLKCILNLIEYDGTVKINANTISYMPQDLALFDFKTVYENVCIPLIIKNKKVDNKKVDNILADLGILSLKNVKVSKLSGGEQSRVALARSLILESKLLLLDEPLSKLDYLTKYSILELLQDLKNKYCLTLIYVTHNIDEALKLGNRVLILGKKTTVLEAHNIKENILMSKLMEQNEN